METIYSVYIIYIISNEITNDHKKRDQGSGSWLERSVVDYMRFFLTEQTLFPDP